MDSNANALWFLRKHEDGSVFGPMPFDQVYRWAAGAQIAPQDKVSHDQQTWLKAPMVPELEMDWLVEVTIDRYYGPTTLGAIQEFLRLGEIGEETFVINTCDGARRPIKDLTDLLQLPSQPTLAHEAGEAPVVTTLTVNLRDRISDLEARYRELEEQFILLQEKQQHP
jgi:hypothetical protein